MDAKQFVESYLKQKVARLLDFHDSDYNLDGCIAQIELDMENDDGYSFTLDQLDGSKIDNNTIQVLLIIDHAVERWERNTDLNHGWLA